MSEPSSELSSELSSPFPVKPFRFGVQLSTAATGGEWAETARRVETLGYDVATMPDHFGGQLAPMPALQAVLDATTTLRAGALVFDNDYKHPAILAKELARPTARPWWRVPWRGSQGACSRCRTRVRRRAGWWWRRVRPAAPASEPAGHRSGRAWSPRRSRGSRPDGPSRPTPHRLQPC